MHANNLCGSRQELRHHFRWMQRNPELRIVFRLPDLRRWRRCQCLRLIDLRTHNLLDSKRDVRLNLGWLRRNSELRNVLCGLRLSKRDL
jgi:hypothetical protein